MLSEDDIIDINNILVLCDTPKLNPTKETAYLNAIGSEVTAESDKYKLAQIVILDRLKNQTAKGGQLSRLFHLAEAKGVSLTEKEVPEKEVTLPFLAGRIRY